jgi:hypothetical protein
VLRTLALEPGEHDLLGVLNDNIADGRDVSWIWDADFELLAGRVRSATCSGTRAAELALRLKYAGVDPARIVCPGLASALCARRSRRAERRRCMRCPPTPRCSRCASCSSRAGRRAAHGRDRPRGSTEVVWHDLECGAYRADLPLWRELAARARFGSPILDVGAGTGRVALDLARAGHE